MPLPIYQFIDISYICGIFQKLKDHHRPRIKALIEGKPDYVAIETIPSLVEAKAVVDMLADEFPGVKAWVSYMCKVSLRM